VTLFCGSEDIAANLLLFKHIDQPTQFGGDLLGRWLALAQCS
jgi:hypothetical protein